MASQTARNASQRKPAFKQGRSSFRRSAQCNGVYKTNYKRSSDCAKILRLNHSSWSTSNLGTSCVSYYAATLSITATHKITPYVDCEPIRGLSFLKDKKFVAGDPSKEDCVLENMVYWSNYNHVVCNLILNLLGRTFVSSNWQWTM